MIFTCKEMSVGIIASGSRIDTIVLATSRAYNDNIITKDSSYLVSIHAQSLQCHLS